MSKSVINFRVEDHEKKRLQQEARALNFRSLGQYVASILLQRELANVPELAAAEPPIGNNSPVQTRVSDEEKMLFVARCRQEGLTQSEVLRRQLRIFLTQKPDFCGQELAELNDANGQLQAIGRNLNQVVRRLQSDKEGHVHVDSTLLGALLDEVKAQKKAIRSLMSRSIARSRHEVE